MEDHEWNAKTDAHKLDWLRKQSDDLLNLMVQNFQTLESHFKALQAEQAKLAEALDHETRRSKRATRAR